MFKKEKTVIFGVSDPKSVRFEHVPKPSIFWGDPWFLAKWGGKPKILRNRTPNYRFPFRKSHFRLENRQNFRLRRANDTTPIPPNFRLRRSEKIDFWRLFWSIFDIYFPPILEGYGGEIFIPPPISEGYGGETEKPLPPHIGGEKRCPAWTYIKSLVPKSISCSRKCDLAGFGVRSDTMGYDFASVKIGI